MTDYYTKAQYKKDIARFNELKALLKHPTKNFGKRSGSTITKKQAREEVDELEYIIDKYKNADFKQLEKNKKVLEADEKLFEEIKKFDNVADFSIKKNKEGDVVIKPTIKPILDDKQIAKLSNEEKSELKKLEETNEKKIKKLEKVIEDQTKVIEQEIKISTNDKGEKEIDIKKKVRAVEDSDEEDDYDGEVKYGKDKKRHKKFYVPDEQRPDVSSEYKMKLKNAVMIGKAGGQRKILECPHCKGQMWATSVRSSAGGKRERTDKQKRWLEHITETGKRPEYIGLRRPDIVKAASKTWDKEKGMPITLETSLTKEIYEEDKNRNSKHH